MRRPLILTALATAAASFLAPACAMESSDCSYDGTCAAVGPSNPDGGPSSEGGEDGDGGGPVVPIPANCKEDADAKSAEAAGCVVDAFAVFVDAASGDDTAAGTKERPLQHLAAAVEKANGAGKRRVYACTGTYAEHVRLTSAISIYGGFACKTWASDGSKPTIAPGDKGYALHIENVSAAVTISDVELVGPDVSALKDGTSSIAVFASKSNVTFVRALIKGGAPANGADGKAGDPGALTGVSSGAMDAKGNAGTEVAGGAKKVCTCSSSTEVTTGGVGGNMGGGGGPGLPSYPATGGRNGAPGPASPSSCALGAGTGGADAPLASHAAKVDTLGSLSFSGWSATSGTR